MTDIVERLRVRAGDERRNYYGSVDAKLDVEAADEIERLRGIEDAAKKAADIYETEIERLRAALADIEDLVDNYADADDGQPNLAMRVYTTVRIAMRREP